MGSYTRESWRILTEPTVPLPFYLLRPEVRAAEPAARAHPAWPRPSACLRRALFTATPRRQAQIREGERDIAVQAVEQGYLVIAPTTRAFGETRSPADKEKNAVSSCRLQLMHDLLRRADTDR